MNSRVQLELLSSCPYNNVKPNAEGTLIDIEFGEKFYGVSVSKEPPVRQTVKSCSLSFRVKAARGLRFFVQKVRYSGYATLPKSSVMMQFSSNVYFVDNAFTELAGQSQKAPITGERDDFWFMTHEIPIENSGWTKCFRSEDDYADINIDTALSLKIMGDLPNEDASAYLTRAIATAETTKTLPSTSSSMTVNVATEACEPSR